MKENSAYMNEFDKIVRDKLNEEDDFPRMDANWQKLAARMAPVATPKLVPHPQLVAWKWAVAATGLLLVSSNIWWWFHQKEANNTIVSAPTTHQSNDAHINVNTVTKTDTVYKIVYRDAASNGPQKSTNLPQKSNATEMWVEKNTPSVSKPNFVEKQAELPTNKPIIQPKTLKNEPQNLVAMGKIDNKTNPISTQNKENPRTIVSNEKIDNKANPISTEKTEGKSNSVSMGKTDTKKSVVSTENNKPEPLKTAEKMGEKSQNTLSKEANTVGIKETPKEAVVAENKENKTPISTTEKPVDTKIAAVETPKETKPETGISPDKKPENTAKPTITASTDTKQDMELAPIIKPLKWKPSFSIGVSAMMASPTEREGSTLKGGGITLGLKLNEHFRADIAANMGELDYHLREHKPHWKIPNDPRDKPVGGPPQGSELREIRGHQIRKQVALSLTYLFTSKGWFTPKLELGYVVQRIANQSAKFDFRDPSTGTDLSLTEISAQQTFKNLWNIGLGVEKTFGKFNADVTMAFQKDFSDKSVDMLVLRGGLRYNF
jgi:hypothetical protein